MGIASDALKNFKGFSLKNMPEVEPLSPGHRACQGCGEVLALRQAMKAVGTNVIVCSATGCMEIITSPFPQTAWRVPWIHVAFENAGAVVSGVEAAYKAMNRKKIIDQPDVTFLAYGGDGATADIGLQALSGALERGHNFIYLCLDNEAYMNTGIQRSSSTPFGASTTTSPPGKKSSGQSTWKKNMAEIAVAHVHTLCGHRNPGLPGRSHEQGEKGFARSRPRLYPHLLSMSHRLAVRDRREYRSGKAGRESKVFPLYEVIDGEYYLSRKVAKPKPVSEYFKPQRRFRHLTEAEIQYIQTRVDEQYEKLLKKCVVEEKKKEKEQ